jgi:hypothetical protein
MMKTRAIEDDRGDGTEAATPSRKDQNRDQEQPSLGAYGTRIRAMVVQSGPMRNVTFRLKRL